MSSRQSSPYRGSKLRSWLRDIPLNTLEQTPGTPASSARSQPLVDTLSHTLALDSPPADIDSEHVHDTSTLDLSQRADTITGDQSSSHRSGNTSYLSASQQATSEQVDTSLIDLESRTNGVAPRPNLDNGSELLIPLPESRSSADEQQQQNDTDAANDHGIAGSSQRNRKGYWQSTSALFQHLPHLKTINPGNHRHKAAGKVSCIDLLGAPSEGAALVDEFTVWAIPNLATLKNRVSKLRVVEGAQTDCRLLLVEDLSPNLIEALGSAFDIDPEAFAEHLHRSGYDHADYNDPPPDRWATSSMPKSHVSMTWFRPVYQSPIVSEWITQPADLLNKVTELVKNRETRHLSSIQWADPERRRNGRRRAVRFKHSVAVNTNIFRRSWPMSIRTLARHAQLEGEIYGDVDDLMIDTPEDGLFPGIHNGNAHLVPTAWEERVTLVRYDHSKVPIIILLLDPLPSFVDSQKSIVLNRRQADIGVLRNRVVIAPIDFVLPAVPRAITDLPANKLLATPDAVARFGDATTTLISTASTIKQRLLQQIPSQHAPGQKPIVELLQIILKDNQVFSQHVEWALDEIGQDSLDDYLLTKQLAQWRKLITDLEIEVPVVENGLVRFLDLLYRDQPRPHVFETIVDHVRQDAQRIKARLDGAYAGLRADMQFTESRRSITEAKTVTKLTELAFLFIPLSFASSLFSMSITELQDGVAVWTFIVTALGLALLSYAIRLVVASDFIADSSRSALEKFWARRNVRRGTNAPMLTLIFLTVEEIWHRRGAQIAWKTAVVLFFSIFIVVPVALIWPLTRLDTGFSTAITLVLLLSSAAFGLFVYMGEGIATLSGAGTWANQSDATSSGSEESV